MKNRSLKIIGVFFVLLAVFLTVYKKQEGPVKEQFAEVREVVKTKQSRSETPSQEIVFVEYSTKAFLNEGEPETEN